jgi:hypothetical protein
MTQIWFVLIIHSIYTALVLTSAVLLWDFNYFIDNLLSYLYQSVCAQ